MDERQWYALYRVRAAPEDAWHLWSRRSTRAAALADMAADRRRELYGYAFALVVGRGGPHGTLTVPCDTATLRAAGGRILRPPA